MIGVRRCEAFASARRAQASLEQPPWCRSLPTEPVTQRFRSAPRTRGARQGRISLQARRANKQRASLRKKKKNLSRRMRRQRQVNAGFQRRLTVMTVANILEREEAPPFQWCGYDGESRHALRQRALELRAIASAIASNRHSGTELCTSPSAASIFMVAKSRVCRR